MSTWPGLGVARYLLTMYCALSDVDKLQNRPTEIRHSMRIAVRHWRLQCSMLAFDRKPHWV